MYYQYDSNEKKISANCKSKKLREELPPSQMFQNLK